MLHDNDEQKLAIRASEGDQAAFARLAGIHAASLYTLALRMTGMPAEAEDMVQDCFLRAFANLHRFDKKKRFHTWLYTICLNVVRDCLRKRKAQPQRLPHEALNALHDNRPLPEQQLQSQERREALFAAVETLPLEQREALVLRFFQDLSFAEVAEICQITENAAKKRVYHALSKLHEILDSETLACTGARIQGGKAP